MTLYAIYGFACQVIDFMTLYAILVSTSLESGMCPDAIRSKVHTSFMFV